MKYRIGLFLVILVMVLSSMVIPDAQAKPRPTAYPEIGTFEIQSYPEPIPDFPFPGNPPHNKGYVWGMYFTDARRWFVSKYTASADPDVTVTLCTAQDNPYYQICFRHRTGYDESMQYIGYQDGMSWYQTIPVADIPISPCGWWGAMPDTSNWNGEPMELHQPNWYFFPCPTEINEIYLPFVRK